MEIPLNKKECAMSVTHHNNKRKQSSSLVNKGIDYVKFEIFENYCSNIYNNDINIDVNINNSLNRNNKNNNDSENDNSNSNNSHDNNSNSNNDYNDNDYSDNSSNNDYSSINNNNLIFDAEGLGIGGSVRILEFQINGILNKNIEKGKQIRVKVKKIISESKTVMLELVDK